MKSALRRGTSFAIAYSLTGTALLMIATPARAEDNLREPIERTPHDERRG